MEQARSGTHLATSAEDISMFIKRNRTKQANKNSLSSNTNALSTFTLTVLNMNKLLKTLFFFKSVSFSTSCMQVSIQEVACSAAKLESVCALSVQRLQCRAFEELKKKSVWLWAKQVSLPSSFFGSFSTAELLKQGNGQETNRASRLNQNLPNCVAKNWVSSKFTGRVSNAGVAMSEWVLMTVHHYFEPRRSWKRW